MINKQWLIIRLFQWRCNRQSAEGKLERTFII